MSRKEKLDKILLFDGVCNLCNAAVQYVLKKNHQKDISFASLQSSFSSQILSENNLDTKSLKTVIYIKDKELLSKSSAFLALMNDLGGMHKLLLIFYVVPRFLRDAMYDLVANNRYAVFGKKNECYIPTPELAERFIQD